MSKVGGGNPASGRVWTTETLTGDVNHCLRRDHLPPNHFHRRLRSKIVARTNEIDRKKQARALTRGWKEDFMFCNVGCTAEWKSRACRSLWGPSHARAHVPKALFTFYLWRKVEESQGWVTLSCFHTLIHVRPLVIKTNRLGALNLHTSGHSDNGILSLLELCSALLSRCDVLCISLRSSLIRRWARSEAASATNIVSSAALSLRLWSWVFCCCWCGLSMHDHWATYEQSSPVCSFIPNTSLFIPNSHHGLVPVCIGKGIKAGGKQGMHVSRENHSGSARFFPLDWEKKIK